VPVPVPEAGSCAEMFDLLPWSNPLMPRLARFLSLSILALGLSTAAACKTRTSSGSRAASSEAKPHVPGLPKPLRLPAEPAAAMHVAAPEQALATLAAYAGSSELEGRALLERLVSSATDVPGDLIDQLDLQRPWNAAVVEGQTIVHLPIAAGGLDVVAGLLAAKPSVGAFGAVDLERPATERGPKLAWLDRASATLTLAETTEGLATGRELAGAYGKSPLFFTIEGAQLRSYVPDAAIGRVTVTGAGLHDFEATVDGLVLDRPELELFADGALTGMLESPQVALGASTKYAQHEETVRSIIAQASRQVSRQNFLVRGTLEDMLKRASSVLRSWNGRVLAGVGPSRHLLLAFGSDDPQRAETATLHLVRGAVDNLSMARSFGLSVPNVRFAKNKTSAGNSSVHVIALSKARSFLPPEIAPLIDERGDLRIAFAFPQRSGGAMMVAGPNAPDVLADWIVQTSDATPGSDSVTDLIAATLAVGPKTLAPVLADQSGRAVLQLEAETAATHVVVRRSGEHWTMAVKGPAPSERPTGTRAADRRARVTGGKPAVGHRASKPVR
jgi:hypothetical protein